MSALSMTKLARRGPVEELGLNVAECVLRKRFTLPTIIGHNNDPRGVAHSILGKTNVNRWSVLNLRM